MSSTPLLVPLDKIKDHDDVLTDDFIAETLKRSKKIEAGRQKMKAAADDINANIGSMSALLKKMDTGFNKQADAFSGLVTAARANAEANQVFVEELKKLSEKMQEVSYQRLRK